MANMEKLKKAYLLDWENELEYQKEVIKDPNATNSDKERARQRIKVAESWIKKLKEK